MGYFDEFCIVCGCPFYLYHILDLQDILSSDFQNYKNYKYQLSHLHKNYQSFHWIYNKIGIYHNDQHISLGNYNLFGGFDILIPKQSLFLGTQYKPSTFHCPINFHFDNIPQGQLYGIACHKSCYSLLKQHLNYKLSFQQLWPFILQNKSNTSNQLLQFLQPSVSQYQGQDFDVPQLLIDNNKWILQDPLTNKKNQKRILHLWKHIIQSLHLQ